MILTVGLIVSLWVLITALLYRYLTTRQVKRQHHLITRFDGMLSKAMVPHTSFYNGAVHLIISFLLGVGCYAVTRQYLGTVSSFSSSVLCGILPTAILRISLSVTEQKVRKDAINFYATFSNHCSIGFDIFTAFRMSIPELNEPFKGAIRRMIAQYDTRVDPIMCLQAAADELEVAEIHSFFRMLIFQYVEGGDVVKLTNDYIKDLGQLIKLDEKEGAEDQVLNMGIYILIAAQFFFLGLFLTSNQRDLVVGTVYGEIALAANFIICIVLILQTFIKPRRA